MANWESIGRLALPMALAEIVEFLAVLGVVAMMGRMDDEALYIRSLYQPIAFVVLALSTAFAISHQVSAALSRGKGRPWDVLPAALSMARVWLVVSGTLCLLLALCAPGLAGLLQVDPAARGDFVTFLRLTCVAEASVVGATLCAASLRGYGKARAAAAITLTAAAVKVGLVGVLGLGLGWGFMSVPVAGLAAGGTGLLLGLVLLRRSELWSGRRPSAEWRPEVLGHLWRIGTPVAASFLVIAGYNLGLLWTLAPFDTWIIAGFSVATTLQTLVLLAGMALGSATAIVLNQQRGAGHRRELRRVALAGLRLAGAVYLVVAGLVVTLAGPLSQLMSGDPQVADETARYLTTVGLTYVVQGPVLAALTLMEQIGGGFLAIMLNIVYFAVAVFAGHLAVRSTGDPGSLYLTIALCNLLGVSVPVVAMAYVRRLRPAPG